MDTNLDTMTTAQILAIYNQLADKPVTKFANRAAAIRRTAALLAVQANLRPTEPATIKPEPKQTKVAELLALFEAADSKTRGMLDLKDALGRTENEVRGLIDSARSAGAKIVSCGRGTKEWRLEA